MLTVQLVGYEQALAAVDFFGVRVAIAASTAALREAHFELPLTKAQVPVRSGQLQASGRVEQYPTDFTGTVAFAAIVYGGPAGSAPGQTEDVDYALIVHEDLEAYHSHGKAKYIEDVVNEEFGSGRAQERMAGWIAELMAL